jgi:hypothetical protein
VAKESRGALASLRRLECTSARLRPRTVELSTPERKVLLSIHRKALSSRVVTLAERPKLSAKLISPTISPGPKTAKITSVPSGVNRWILTEPSMMM